MSSNCATSRQRDLTSRTVQAFQVLSDHRFTKHKIFMAKRYLVPFVVKSTSAMINDRSCYGKELQIIILTQAVRCIIYNFPS